MEKRRGLDLRGVNLVIFLCFACGICLVPIALIVGDPLGMRAAWVARLETQRLEAQAQAYDARAALAVAEAQAAILEEAAAAVAADRRLVTVYALSSNLVVLGGVLVAGVVGGVVVGRRYIREVNNA